MTRISRTVLALAAALGTMLPVTAQAAPRPAATKAAQPDRILDTRIGLGAAGPIGPGRVVTLPVKAASAAGASSVVLNVTATEASAAGWVRVWPCGSAEPATSSLNYVPGQIAANAVAVKLGSGGAVCLSTYAPVQLVADVSGWFTGTSDFTGTQPDRVVDTRITGDALQPGVERRVRVAGHAGVPSSAASAALNITVASPPVAGWVVAYPCGSATDASTLNFTAGEIVANLTMVGLSGGDVCLKSYGPADVVVDVFGWSSGGGDLRVQSPHRLVDTRTWGYGQLRTGSKIALRVAGLAGVPNTAAGALLTVTVADTAGYGYVTAWPCDQPLPTASTINTWPNQLRSNLAMVKLAADGTACLQLYTTNFSALDLVVDAVGWTNGNVSRDAPPATPTPPTQPVAPTPSGHFSTLPVGATLPSDAQCAAAVRPAAEIRPDNAGYNSTAGSTVQTGWFARVTGSYTGTTDQIIQWAACKWGIDEDIVRAQAAKESAWHQRNGGDWFGGPCAPGAPTNGSQCADSVGIMQVRYSAHKPAFAGSGNALTSTAYNLDYALAVIRSCFEGRETWLNQFERGRDYAAGDLWGCVGLWFSGRWYYNNADYIAAVQSYLSRRVWEQPDFPNW